MSPCLIKQHIYDTSFILQVQVRKKTSTFQECGKGGTIICSGIHCVTDILTECSFDDLEGYEITF